MQYFIFIDILQHTNLWSFTNITFSLRKDTIGTSQHNAEILPNSKIPSLIYVAIVVLQSWVAQTTYQPDPKGTGYSQHHKYNLGSYSISTKHP